MPGTFTTVGTPSSRATMAACESGPPSSVTTAAARGKSGVQPTSVVCTTRTLAGLELRHLRLAVKHAGAPLDYPGARGQPP